MNQPPLLPPEAHARRPGFGAGIRTWFLTGLIVAGPLALTAWIVWWFISLIDGWVKPLVPAGMWPDVYLPMHLPGVGVVLAFLGLTMLGFLDGQPCRQVAAEARLDDPRPHAGGARHYKSLKQIFETIFSQSVPAPPRRACAVSPARHVVDRLHLAPPSEALASHMPPVEHMSVFLPCTPNPTTGFYFYLPASEVVEVPLTPEEGAKLIMSAGLIQPDTQERLAALAASARTGDTKRGLSPPEAA